MQLLMVTEKKKTCHRVTGNHGLVATNGRVAGFTLGSLAWACWPVAWIAEDRHMDERVAQP